MVFLRVFNCQPTRRVGKLLIKMLGEVHCRENRVPQRPQPNRAQLQGQAEYCINACPFLYAPIRRH